MLSRFASIGKQIGRLGSDSADPFADFLGNELRSIAGANALRRTARRSDSRRQVGRCGSNRRTRHDEPDVSRVTPDPRRGSQIGADFNCAAVRGRNSRSVRTRTIAYYRIAPAKPSKIKPRPMPVLATSPRTASSSRIGLDIQGCTAPLRSRCRTKARGTLVVTSGSGPDRRSDAMRYDGRSRTYCVGVRR